MSKQSSERRSYSVDEMMEKLKDGERAKREVEDSELVTRPDGSQVVRVRRRRRRSKQPHKEKEVRRKRGGLIALVATVVLVVALVSTVLVLLARFNSKGYRDQMKARILAATGAHVGITDLSVTPFRARAKSFQFAWSADGIVKSLRLNDLSATLEVTSYLGADWNGKEVLSDSGQLILGPPREGAAPVVLDGTMPFDYEGYRCGKLDIVYEQVGGEPALRLSAVELTMRPKKEGGAQFLINGGRAAIPGWNELKIDRGLAELEENRFRIVSLRIKPTGPEAVEGGEGEATLRSSKPMRAAAPAELEMEFKHFPLRQLLGGSVNGLGRFLNGRIETSDGNPGRIEVDPRAPKDSVIEIPFSGIEGTVKDFLFLRGLDGILKSVDYTAPSGGVLSGVFMRDKNGMSLRDFEFETKALLKLQGNLEVTSKGGLGGRVRIGIPQGVILDRIAAPYRPAFSAPELGYCWVTITLAGTVERPLDDFSRVLQQVAVDDGSPSRTPGEPDELLEDAFQRLTEEGNEEVVPTGQE